jgi:hypothetical protein
MYQLSGFAPLPGIIITGCRPHFWKLWIVEFLKKDQERKNSSFVLLMAAARMTHLR